MILFVFLSDTYIAFSVFLVSISLVYLFSIILFSAIVSVYVLFVLPVHRIQPFFKENQYFLLFLSLFVYIYCTYYIVRLISAMLIFFSLIYLFYFFSFPTFCRIVTCFVMFSPMTLVFLFKTIFLKKLMEGGRERFVASCTCPDQELNP